MARDAPGERARLTRPHWEVRAANLRPPFPFYLLDGLSPSEQSVGLAGHLGFPSPPNSVLVRRPWRDMHV